MDMRKRLAQILVAIGFCLAIHVATSTPVSAQGAQGLVWGTVFHVTNRPIPGLTVSLVHPVVGRSHPAFTDPIGRFVFYNVPVVPKPYYLEVYWGRELLYRGTVFMNASGVQVPPIVLR